MRVGVDEAGRGPVLGSLFAAAVAVPDGDLLPDAVDDSKQLDADHRERLATRLREHPDVAVGVASVPPDRIDDPGTDMTGLTVSAQADAVAAALEAAGADPTGGDSPPELVADAGETSAERFGHRLADGIPAEMSVTAEHRADERYDIVGAASIVAKVERDAHVESLADEHPGLVESHGCIGSGYPSDPTTRTFLESYVDGEGDVPPFARRSWETCRKLLEDTSQSGLEEF